MSVEVDIVLSDNYFQGEDKLLDCFVVDKGGIPVNITGWTISFRLAATLGGADILGTPIAGVIVDALVGHYTITIPSIDTLGQNPVTYYYTIRRTNTGARNELSFGTLVLRQIFAQ